MPKRKGAIIPDPVNPSGEYRRVLCIPASPDWIALVTGALYPLTQEWYWDAATGDIDAVVARAKQMYFEYQDQSGDCDMPGEWVVGEIKMSASLNALPSGWLECNGQSLLRADYPDLFAELGTQWGAVDGTHFNIPDYRSRSPMGQGRLDGSGSNPLYQMGNKVGELEHQLTVAELAEHQHDTIQGNLWQITTTGAAGVAPSGGGSVLDINTGVAGSDEPHNTVHPVSVCRFWIYAGA